MRQWRTLATSVVLVSGVVGGLAGCGPSQAQQEVNSLNHQLAVPGSGVRMIGENASVGALDPTVAWVVGPPRTVTVLKASMIALPGFKLPQLASVGAVPGCAGSDNDLQAYSDQQNQVDVAANGHDLRLLPLLGYRMRMGNAKCAPAFVYAVVSTTPGDYAVAGLRLTVQSDGRAQTLIAYDGLFVWYYAVGAVPSDSSFNQKWNAASSAQDQWYNSSH